MVQNNATFDFAAPADLFPARSRGGQRPVGYRRFDTACAAIQFAIERMPTEFLNGTYLEVKNERYDGTGIRNLYNSKEYPLIKKSAL